MFNRGIAMPRLGGLHHRYDLAARVSVMKISPRSRRKHAGEVCPMSRRLPMSSRKPATFRSSFALLKCSELCRHCVFAARLLLRPLNHLSFAKIPSSFVFNAFPRVRFAQFHGLLTVKTPESLFHISATTGFEPATSSVSKQQHLLLSTTYMNHKDI